MSKLSVYIADGDLLRREELCREIPWEELDCEIVGTGDEREAQAFLTGRAADLLIADESGLELAEVLAGETKATRVILIFGSAQFDRARRALKTGCVLDILTAPINYSELIEDLKTLCAALHQKKQSISFSTLHSLEQEQLRRETGVKYDRLLERIVKAAAASDETKALGAYVNLWDSFETDGFSDGMVYRYVLELVLRCSGMMYMRNIIPLTMENAEKDFYKDISHLTDRESLRMYGEYLVARICARTTSNETGEVSPLIKSCVAIIQQDFSNPAFSLQYVAAQLHVSSNYLSAYFKREMGVGFLKYVNSIRITRAQELLKDIRLKTYEVSHLVGLEDQRYFSRLFKEQTGLTPNEYRTAIFQQK